MEDTSKLNETAKNLGKESKLQALLSRQLNSIQQEKNYKEAQSLRGSVIDPKVNESVIMPEQTYYQSLLQQN